MNYLLLPSNLLIFIYINLINNNFKQNIKDKFLPEFSLFHNKWMEDITFLNVHVRNQLSSSHSHIQFQPMIFQVTLKDLSKACFIQILLINFLFNLKVVMLHIINLNTQNIRQ